MSTTEFAIADVVPGKLNALVKNIMRQTNQTDPNEAVRLVNSGEWLVVRKPEPEPKIYLRHLFGFNLATTDAEDLESAKEVFRAYFDSDFENWGIAFSAPSSVGKITVEELTADGKFSDFLGNTAEDLEKRRLTGSQFLSICRDHPDQLQGGGYANFFVLTRGDEEVAEDLSNVFVASVRVRAGGKLGAGLYEFRYDFVWRGDYGPRLFSPVQL